MKANPNVIRMAQDQMAKMSRAVGRIRGARIDAAANGSLAHGRSAS